MTEIVKLGVSVNRRTHCQGQDKYNVRHHAMMAQSLHCKNINDRFCSCTKHLLAEQGFAARWHQNGANLTPHKSDGHKKHSAPAHWPANCVPAGQHPSDCSRAPSRGHLQHHLATGPTSLQVPMSRPASEARLLLLICRRASSQLTQVAVHSCPCHKVTRHEHCSTPQHRKTLNPPAA